jgi:tRNA 2-thiouridine synthesizing protein A
MKDTIAEQTVEQIKTTRTGAMETLDRFGINHCCGAHLSLREAAAAAGVPLTTVLEALARVPVRLDVRGLEPPQPLVRVLERVASLGDDETLEVIHDRRPLLLYPQLDDRGFVHETDELDRGVVRIRIRRRPA